MVTEQWQFALLMGVLAFHLLAAGLAYRHQEASPAVTSASDAIDQDAKIIRCPECNSKNDFGYRYCRSCVGELPGAIPSDGARNTPLRRFAR